MNNGKLATPKGVPVVFVTTGFGDTPTGPSVYAHYLWEGFRDDPDIEFHVVAPGFPQAHPRLHASGPGRGSLDLYDRVCRKAMEVADALGDGVIVHVNNSHMGRRLLATRHRLWGQVNDYQNTDVYRDLPRLLRTSGPRRVLALCRRRWLERQLVHRQELTLCNSRYTRQRVLQAYRPPQPGRVQVLYKAVETEFFGRPDAPPADPARRDPACLRVLLVGSDFVVKGVDLLVEACLALDFPVHLCVVGGTEADFAASFPVLAARLNESRLARHFAGRQPRERVRDLLWHSDVFVLPSRSEALGVAILESLAAGVPVVASRVGGIPEIVQGIPSCALVPRCDASALREALQQQRAARRATTAAASPPRLPTGFDKTDMLRALRSLYLGAHA